MAELHRIDGGRLWVRLISKQAFRQYMDFRNETNESLAAKAKCSTAVIAFLRSTGSASRDTVKPSTARRIEEALNAPTGSLFAATVFVGSTTARRSA